MSALGTNFNQRHFATLDDMQRAFTQHQPELEWFAYFITGDEVIAQDCVVDARSLSVSQHNQVFEDWLLEWARYATVRSAIQRQRERRLLQDKAPEQERCAHSAHEPLSASSVEFVEDNTEALTKRLSALSRIALVVYGIQKHSLCEAAILAGVPARRVKAAYCAALHCLEVMQCEEIRAAETCSLSFN